MNENIDLNIGGVMCKKSDKYELLTRYLKGELNEEEKQEFGKNLRDDPELSRTVEFLLNFKSGSDEIAWDKIRRPAHQIFERLLSDHKSSKRDSKRAIVTFDSKYFPLPEGIRPAIADTRRIRYQIDDHMLELSLYPVSPGSFEMIGQLSGGRAGEILGIELRKGKTRLHINSNDYQLFRFERVPSGKYMMIITKGKMAIAKVDLDL